MKASKVAKITDTVIDIIQDETGKRRKDIKGNYFVFYAQDFIDSIKIVRLNHGQSNVIVSAIVKKYQIEFNIDDIHAMFPNKDCYSILNLVTYIVQQKETKIIRPFDFTNFDGRCVISNNNISVGALRIIVDANFWIQFDKWYMNNKKSLKNLGIKKSKQDLLTKPKKARAKSGE